MKKPLIIRLLIISLTLLLAACAAHKEQPVHTIENLCTTLESDDALTQSDLEAIVVEYEKAVEQIEKYSDQYTPEEKREIMRLKGRFHGSLARRVKQATLNLMDVVNDWVDAFDGYFEGFEEGYNQEI